MDACITLPAPCPSLVSYSNVFTPPTSNFLRVYNPSCEILMEQSQNVLKLLTLLIHPDSLAHLLSSIGLLVWRQFNEHFPKTKHDKHLEMWAEAQYMHFCNVKWSLKLMLGGCLTISFEFEIENEINENRIASYYLIVNSLITVIIYT